MSNFQNSNNKYINNKNTKYSLDEIEISENNTTHNDSLHKEKIISKTSNKEQINEHKQKILNYYLALNTIQKKPNDTFQELSLNEFSESKRISTKDKNINNYINNPLRKEVIKVGNILKTIKSQKKKKSIISLNNRNIYNIVNINNPIVTEVDEENSSTIINETKNTKSITTSNHKEKNIINNNINYNKSTNDKNIIKENYNFSTTVTKNKNKYSNNITNNNSNCNGNNKKYNLDIINDLEESIDINVKNDIKREKNYSNNIMKNQKINQYFEIEAKQLTHKYKNGIFNSRIFKSFDFRNLRKNGINYSIHEIKHIKKWSNVDIILKNKTKTTTGKKLRKKYERSELKTNRYEQNSLNKNDIYIKEDINNELDMNLKYLTNEKLAKNLMGKFNMCSQGEENFLENIMFNINERSKNDSNYEEDDNEKLEFIDFLSNESGIYKQNNNINSKDFSNNNDTFIIKTNDINNNELENENGTSNKNKIMSENKQRKSSYNLNYNNNYIFNINKSIENYNSPLKTKEFTLFPLDHIKKSKLILNNNYNQNENSILRRNISQKLVNIIPIEPEPNEFLDLSDSPSYINTQSPKKLVNNNTSGINSANNNNNSIIEKNCQNYPQQQQHTIYDLEFYQNLLSANNRYKKINFQNIFKNQPLVNWEERLNTLLWMMRICEEFAFKRDTYHYSCFYFDLYLFLSKEKIKNTNEFKLIGITCISISAKIEEVQIPKLVEYAESINDSYKIEDIINTEKKICGALGWKLIPMTISSWLNWYTCQWDLFVYSIDDIKNRLLLFSDDENILFFKRQNEVSYYNYRRIYQIIDLIALDYHSYKYENRYLIAACFLILICLHYNLEFDFNKKILKKKSNLKNSNKKDICKVLQDIYIQFIEQSFDFSFEDKKLNDCISYIYKFINFKFSYDIPLIFQVEQEHINDYSYEDFISYQTTCENIYPFFKDMNKNEAKKVKNKKSVKINKKLPIKPVNNKNNKNNKSQSSLIKQNTIKTKKSFSSRKSSLTKDNSKNKISNL
ncbi:MAG: cyclin [Bacteroidaceae bacterium]|nr:cyclin [Bacteroidaceae bacterium]